MPQCHAIDTFPAFSEFWSQIRGRALDAQIELWAADYMSGWPELLARQQMDYAEQGMDWRSVAKERIFPFLPERLPDMTRARRGLLISLEPVYRRAQETLGLDFDVLFVIYVGIGCGAGWATTLEGRPAVLFGLENVAARGWTGRETLAALAAHEVGHLLHQQWRRRSSLTSCEGAFWQLYEEGFAQRCEHIIMAKDTWHEKEGQDDWLNWCNENISWLAAEFLRFVDRGEPINPFFGSWFDIRGQRQTGYYLGHELVREWEDEIGLKEVALLPCDEVRRRARSSLDGTTTRGPGAPTVAQ
ncbi:MAG: hypothetical protein PVH62_01590 [Anaerolineae bacterium]|jgi:hypothetical protein